MKTYKRFKKYITEEMDSTTKGVIDFTTSWLNKNKKSVNKKEMFGIIKKEHLKGKVMRDVHFDVIWKKMVNKGYLMPTDGDSYMEMKAYMKTVED
jgi:hypothetical protein